MPPQPAVGIVLVNCTPVGHVSERRRHADRRVACSRDVTSTTSIYNPTTTRLLREAAKAGCQTIGGLEMLVAQALEQFEWWTGMKAPAGVMREAALKRLAEFMRQ